MVELVGSTKEISSIKETMILITIQGSQREGLMGHRQAKGKVDNGKEAIIKAINEMATASRMDSRATGSHPMVTRVLTMEEAINRTKHRSEEAVGTLKTMVETEVARSKSISIKAIKHMIIWAGETAIEMEHIERMEDTITSKMSNPQSMGITNHNTTCRNSKIKRRRMRALQCTRNLSMMKVAHIDRSTSLERHKVKGLDSFKNRN